MDIGWAKRWFQLSPSGVLSYSISPTSVTRGSIQIMLATISSNPDQRLIHIDSGTMLYHLKTLTTEDHDRWTEAFRAYRSGGNVDINGNGTDPMTSSDEHTSPLHQEIDRGLTSARGLGSTVDRFAENINVLKALLDQLSHVPGTQELTPKIAGLTQQLERDRNEISKYTKEQQNHWQVIHEALSNTTRSAPTYQNGEFEPSSDLKRMSTSARSSVSDLFFDAEDIILSGGDEDFLEEGDEEEGNDDSSDDDEGMLILDSKSSILLMPSLSDTETNEQESDGSLDLSIAGDVVRRNCLPSHAVGDVGSALSVFRKNVGKDLSTISMPISMNEPLSMLQRACEELEYCDLLDKASTLPDSMDRLIYIVLFAVSSYASSQYRTGRKVKER